MYESAKSSLIFKIIEDEKSVGDLVSQSLASYFKNVSHDYNKQMVQRVYAVTIDDMSRVAAKYLKDLFDPKKSHTTLVCHPMKAPEVAQAFKTLVTPKKHSRHKHHRSFHNFFVFFVNIDYYFF